MWSRHEKNNTRTAAFLYTHFRSMSLFSLSSSSSLSPYPSFPSLSLSLSLSLPPSLILPPLCLSPSPPSLSPHHLHAQQFIPSTSQLKPQYPLRTICSINLRITKDNLLNSLTSMGAHSNKKNVEYHTQVHISRYKFHAVPAQNSTRLGSNIG